RKTLTEAVHFTFSRRKTLIPVDDPIGLTADFWDNPSRPAQARAFARRAGLAASLANGKEILAAIRPFLIPIIEDLRGGLLREGTWLPGGPWR
ncbi:MAG: nucleotidyl transferase AbiEii/AbiGii toxin family protein, partial [Thermoanaerobaculia bacterium]